MYPDSIPGLLPYAINATPEYGNLVTKYDFLKRAGYGSASFPQEVVISPQTIAANLDKLYEDDAPYYYLILPSPNAEDREFERELPTGTKLLKSNNNTWWYWRYGRYLRDYVLCGSAHHVPFPHIPEPFRLPLDAL